ncbi:putative membrane protein [Clostridioides difficile DA00165]|nr:putative membrane protein [Clostridioides difficile DA00165]
MNKKAAIVAAVAIIGLVTVFALGGSKKNESKHQKIQIIL